MTFVLTFLGALTFLDTRSSARSTIEERPCPVAVPTGTTCGFLLVPERRDVPNSRTIKVGFAVHRSAGAAAATSEGPRTDSSTDPSENSSAAGAAQQLDPVVYLGGGPGSPTLQLTGLLVGKLPGRDVVVIEQRGGHYSEPRLSCPEIARGLTAMLTAPGAAPAQTAHQITGQAGDQATHGTHGTPDRSTAGLAREADTCLDRLQAKGVDLRGYRTAEIAADVVDLREALGYRQWNLFGVGYSTRPMLQAAGLDPYGTRAVVLDSFLPAEVKWYDDAAPNLTATVAKLGITARFDAMTARLNAAPAALTTRSPFTRERVTLRLTGDDVATILGEALRDSDVIPIIPALVDGLADGRIELLRPVVDRVRESLTSREWGLYYAVQCQDEAPFNTFTGSARPLLFTGVADAAVCEAWGLPAARRGASSASIAAPILVVGGQLDPATPPEAARKAADALHETSVALPETSGALPAARFVEFAGIGHGAFLADDCGRRTITAFLDDPASDLASNPASPAATPCDPGKLVQPGDLLLTSSAYQATLTPPLLAPGAVFVIVAAVQLLAGLVSLARRARMTVRRRGGTVTVLSVLAGLAGVAFAGLSALSVSNLPAPAALAIGVPPAIAWYGLLVIVATVLSGVEAFRLHARAVQIVPVLTGLACLAWLYGWLLA